MNRKPSPIRLVFSTPIYGRIVEELREDPKAVITIFGDSGKGKTEFIKLLPYIMGEEFVYFDGRHLNCPNEFYHNLCSQLGMEMPHSLEKLNNRIGNGGILFLLDEYWAGKRLLDPLIEFAAQFENRIVTVAGQPSVERTVVYEVNGLKEIR